MRGPLSLVRRRRAAPDDGQPPGRPAPHRRRSNRNGPPTQGPRRRLVDALKEIIADEHVPFLAACCCKPSGLDKRVQWERTWDLQREEDATGQRLDIPVPPKYTGADFQKQSYWRHRGKLDVPKERFISHPGASPDSDSGSLLIGWAGWDHKDQATALIGLIADRSTTDGWDTGGLTPLLAGLLEIMPWAHQWHSEINPAFGQSPAEAYDAYLTSERESRNLTEDTLRIWPHLSPSTAVGSSARHVFGEVSEATPSARRRCDRGRFP
jgi:hypothetical protein